MTKIILVILLIFSTILSYAANKKSLVTMYPPPWKDMGGNLKELIAKEDDWVKTREKIDVIGYWGWLFDVYFNDDEQKAFFQKLNQWDKKFSLEIPVVKGYPWGGTNPPLNGTTAFEFYLNQDKKMKKNGLKQVDYFVFDEPIYASMYAIPHQIANEGFILEEFPNDANQRVSYGAKETAKMIKSLRQLYPKAKIGDVEPYPVIKLDELKTAFDEINSECERIGTKGLDFMRIDVDWSSLLTGQYKGSWMEMKELASYINSKNVDFSMIYWASDKPLLNSKDIDYPMLWYVSIINQGNTLRAIDLIPNEYVIESWLHMDNNMTPESDMTTYTRSVLDFYEYIIKQ